METSASKEFITGIAVQDGSIGGGSRPLKDQITCIAAVPIACMVIAQGEVAPIKSLKMFAMVGHCHSRLEGGYMICVLFVGAAF
jgi:hypothetical protein